MNLRCMDGAVLEANPRDTLALPPATLPMSSAQPRYLPDRPPGGYGFHAPQRTDELEVHRPKLSRSGQRIDVRHRPELGAGRRPVRPEFRVPRSAFARTMTSRV